MKRTLALRLAFLIPLVMVVLQFFIFFSRSTYGTYAGSNPWFFFGQQMFIFWSLLVLPLFVTLETALLSGLEHRSNQWKYLHALPVSRWSIYASKFLLGASLIGLGILALVGFTIVAGLLFRFLKPGLGFEAPVPWAMMAKYAATVYISSWLMIAIQSWVGLRWFSFVVATSFGIVMTISGMIFVNTGWGRL